MNRTRDVVINGIDEGFVDEAAVLAVSLSKFSTIESLHILSCDSASTQKRFTDLTSEVNYSIHFYDVSEKIRSLPNARGKKGIPAISYARLLIAGTLPLKIKTVLYLDVDILIRDRIDELLDFPMQKQLAAVRVLPQKIKLIGSDIEYLFEKYFNAGVMLIDLQKWRDEDLDSKILHLMLQGEYQLMDNDILNLAFNGIWEELDQKWNYLEDERCRFASIPTTFPQGNVNNLNEAVIVHFVGPYKPWKFPLHSPFHIQWSSIYQQIKGRNRILPIESKIIINVMKILFFIFPKVLTQRIPINIRILILRYLGLANRFPR